MFNSPALRAQPADSVHAQPVVSIAFEYEVLTESDLKDVYSAIDVWNDEVLEKIRDLRSESTIYEDRSTLIQDIAAGRVDLGYITVQTYWEILEHVPIDPVCIPVKWGTPTRKYYLLVPADSNSTTLSDLSEKTVVLHQDQESVIQCLEYELLRNDLPLPGNFFSDILTKRTNSLVAYSVFFRQADAAIVPDGNWEVVNELNPQFGKQLKIIAESPDMPHAVVFHNPHSVLLHYDELHDTHLNMHRTVDGQQICALFKIDGFAPVDTTLLRTVKVYLDKLREMKREYLKAGRQHGERQ